jgi:hypothetical protein
MSAAIAGAPSNATKAAASITAPFMKSPQDHKMQLSLEENNLSAMACVLLACHSELKSAVINDQPAI